MSGIPPGPGGLRASGGRNAWNIFWLLRGVKRCLDGGFGYLGAVGLEAKWVTKTAALSSGSQAGQKTSCKWVLVRNRNSENFGLLLWQADWKCNGTMVQWDKRRTNGNISVGRKEVGVRWKVRSRSPHRWCIHVGMLVNWDMWLITANCSALRSMTEVSERRTNHFWLWKSRSPTIINECWDL